DQLRKAAGGIDIGKAAGGGTGGAPPTSDPGTQAAVVETATEFTKGFVKGASDTALGIVNSPAGQIVAGPLGFEQNALNAVITGDPSKLAPVNLGIPDAKTINDPKAQATAVA